MFINFNPNLNTRIYKEHSFVPNKAMDIRACILPVFKSKSTMVADSFESSKTLIKKIVKKEIELSKFKRKQGDYFSVLPSDLLKKQEVLINKAQQLVPSYIEPKESLKKYDWRKDFVLGYKKEKDELMSLLVEPLLSKGVLYSEIPSAVLISGDNRTTSDLIQTVVHKIRFELNVLDLEKDVSNIGFKEKLFSILNDARELYLETGLRTLLICRDVEKFLNFKNSEANIIGRKLNDEDSKKLGSLNKEENLVSYFKALLDTVAKVPDSENSQLTSYATTFLMTSENPHFIHPDLSERNGKIHHIKTEFPKDENLKDIIFSSIRRVDNDFKDFLSDDDWDLIIKELNPSFTKGAFSTRLIERIIFKFFINTTRDLEGFAKEIALIRYILGYPRDISGKECKKQNRISRIFDGVQKKKPLGVMELEDLILQKSLGLATEKENFLLVQKIFEAKALLSFLENKAFNSKLSKREVKLKQEIERLIDLEKTIN